MNINATLFVQIINFFVAYFVLRKIIFVPVLIDIQCEQVKTKELIRTINDLSCAILNKEQHRRDDLLALKKHFLSAQPRAVVMHKKPQLYVHIEDSSGECLDEFSEKLRILLRKKLDIALR